MNDDFSNDFQWAVIRLATFQTERKKPGQLLFATVTLLVPDRPPPPTMEEVEIQKLGKSGINIFFRRFILPSKRAIEWYRSLQKGGVPIPLEEAFKWYASSKQSNVPKSSDKVVKFTINISNLIDDPQWPALGLPMAEELFTHATKSNHPAPFIGNSIARIHRRFGNADAVKETLLLNTKALAFIARRLHIDLKVYSEYLGSAVLVVPDPIIKKIDNFLIPATKKQGERIFYRFIARTGQTLTGLKITLFDKQANLLTNFETLDIPEEGLLDIDKVTAIGTYGYVVTHPNHGILLYSQPTSFLRQMTSNAHIVNEIRKVRVPINESPTSPQIEYSTQRTTNISSRTIGHELVERNVNERIGLAVQRREKATEAARYDQRWFGNNSREEAMAFIRSRVSRARQHIIVADPYFGVLQIPQYLLAITSDGVKVTILTSRLAFESKSTPEENQKCEETIKSENTLSNKLKLFNKELNRIKDSGNTDIDTQVLRGKSSPILHDRFLVIDDQVWFLGNSLNMLGKRASMIIKLPNPDEVLDELDNMLKQTETFDQYSQRYIDREINQ